MTALERATQFVRIHATATALVIVPLAMASPAAATPITPAVFNAPSPSGATLTVHGASGGTATVAGGGSFTSFATTGVTFGGSYDVSAFSAGGTNPWTMTLTLSGTGSGILEDSVPAAYDYTVSSALITPLTSSLIYFINGSQVGTVSPAFAGGSGHLDLSGWAPGTALSTWQVVLTDRFNVNDLAGATLTLSVPAKSSIDIGGTASVAAVPEPASLLLLATGVGLLAVRRRRRPTS